jgi:WD40-like Beta Propeller Repeat
VMRAALLLAALAGCFDGSRAFDCRGDTSRCKAGERCLAGAGGSFCATPDTACPGGFRFAISAGTLANVCLNQTPDGGVEACVNTGDPCDDGDNCTENDKCEGTTCKGQPTQCPVESCAFGVHTTSACDHFTGKCVATNTPCTPYQCAGNQCATGCAMFADCQPGGYCASGKCLPCGDYVTNPSYVPHFGAPAAIPGANAMGSADTSPYLSADGLTLYFASDRMGGMGGLDLWQATRAAADPGKPFGNVKNLGDINKMGDDLDPITPDGKTISFASDRDQAGDFNLLASTYANGMWSFADPINGGTQLGPINTIGRELHPSMTGDGRRLYFQSDRGFVGPGDPLPRLFLATRLGAADPFGSADPLSGLAQGPAWTSPSVAKSGSALFLVDAAVPSRPQPALLHLDAGGLPSGEAHVLANVDLTGGGNLSVTADGCAILFSNKGADPAGDLYWSFRDGLLSCAGAVCGTDDGCCPPACAGLSDADCPLPRTWEVDEWYSALDDNHDYLLLGETPPKAGNYAPTGKSFRVFADKLAGTVALTRYANTACDGKLYSYVALATEMPRANFAKERDLGYVFANAMRATNRLYRAYKESGACDEQITFDSATCDTLKTMQGYTCDPMLGFGVKP